MHPLAAIPSPTTSVWNLGPIPIRAYALCIVAGIFVAVYVALRRWRAVGGKDEDVWNVAGWTVAFGIIGGRLYNLVSDPEEYFLGRPGTSPINALKIWDGGLGIWGAVALGLLGTYIGCRRHGIRLSAFADAGAPGLVAAQGIGRWGNWFNNELYGHATTMPWKLQIHCWDLTAGHAVPGGVASGGETCPPGSTTAGYFQPTFLFESIWDIALAFALVWAARRFTLGRGNTFALYMMGYTAGRGWIEALRTDHANHILGLRLNDWTSIAVFLGGLAWFWFHRNKPTEAIYRRRREQGPADEAPASPAPVEPDPAAPAEQNAALATVERPGEHAEPEASDT